MLASKRLCFVFSHCLWVSVLQPPCCSEEPLSQNLGSEYTSVNLDLLSKLQCPGLEVKGCYFVILFHCEGGGGSGYI